MKKMTQADRDAGLTQADVDAGLRGGPNTRISDEDRTRAKMNAERDAPSIVDQYRDYSKNPEAKAFPVADRKKLKEMAPEAESKRTSNDAIGDLVKKLGSGRVGTTPSSFAEPIGGRKGGAVKMAKGGSVSSASRRADGCAMKGKTKGMMVKMKSGGKTC
jgi:hypothetical protein